MKMRKADEKSEARLEQLRAEAALRGKVESRGIRPPGAPFPEASAEAGYYGTALLKPHQWTWEIPLYFVIGGAAGASAVIGGVARLTGEDRDLCRDAAFVATAGAVVSTALLISDLGRPERFLHMLRVFKKQSPMSVGAWTLVGFAKASAATAFADWLESEGIGGRLVRVIGNLSAAGAAVTGAVIATYTGVLIGATAVPVWNRSIRTLPVVFGVSGFGSAVAILEMLGHRQRALGWMGGAVAVTETGFGIAKELDRDPALEPVKSGVAGAMVRGGAALTGPVQLILRLSGKRRAAGVAMLLGSLLSRYGWMEAGKVSARDPGVPLQLDEFPSPEKST
jgi:hypothetical protein